MTSGREAMRRCAKRLPKLKTDPYEIALSIESELDTTLVVLRDPTIELPAEIPVVQKKTEKCVEQCQPWSSFAAINWHDFAEFVSGQAVESAAGY